MAAVKVNKGDKVYFTRYDATFVIVRANGKRVAVPYTHQPKLMDKAKKLGCFWYNV